MNEEYRKGVKAMFDSLLYRSANNYHCNHELNKQCNIENAIINEWAVDALEDVDEEVFSEWRQIRELRDEVISLQRQIDPHIVVNMSLSNGTSINVREKIRNGESEQETFDSVVGYNSGMCWGMNPDGSEITVDKIEWVKIL